MARYTCSFIVQLSLEEIQTTLINILESCNFEIIYKTDTGDYLMARENPGQVSFAKLVTVEVLIDTTPIIDDEVRLDFVVKNEELPLQFNNHCRQMFDIVLQVIIDNQQWQLIENVVG